MAGSSVNYQVVFDIADAGYRNWSFALPGMGLIAIGLVLVLARKNLSSLWPGRSPPSPTFAFVFLGFGVLWTLTGVASTYRDYASLAEAEESGHTTVAEGRVSNFQPMPISGHGTEHFCVGADCFSYADNLVTAGFNTTSSQGGPIREGLPVRVTHVGNAIVKLEVGQ